MVSEPFMDPDEAPEKQVVVLGQELANASAAEKHRLESQPGAASPLPEQGYDPLQGELSLLDPQPSPLDDTIREVCHKYEQASAADRASMRGSISMDQFYTLLAFGRRSAVFALRESSVERVTEGLTALAMLEEERVDYRDIFVCLGILDHAAHKVSQDADGLLRRISSLAEPPVAKLFINVSERKPGNRNLHSLAGYKEIMTEHGLGLISFGFDHYEPTLDLASAVLDISKLIDRDKYRAGSAEIGSTLPAVWFGRSDKSKVSAILENVHGGASFHAPLLPSETASSDDHTLMVFLVETNSNADAQSLQEFAEASESTDIAKLARASERLFCLIIARSFKFGVEPIESNESLKRFTSGLDEILQHHSQP